jgi:hypothetical protein
VEKCLYNRKELIHKGLCINGVKQFWFCVIFLFFIVSLLSGCQMCSALKLSEANIRKSDDGWVFRRMICRPADFSWTDWFGTLLIRWNSRDLENWKIRNSYQFCFWGLAACRILADELLLSISSAAWHTFKGTLNTTEPEEFKISVYQNPVALGCGCLQHFGFSTPLEWRCLAVLFVTNSFNEATTCFYDALLT